MDAWIAGTDMSVRDSTDRSSVYQKMKLHQDKILIGVSWADIGLLCWQM